jgi:hypothetical protein
MFRLFQNMSNIHKQQLNSELNLHRPRFEGTFFFGIPNPVMGQSWGLQTAFPAGFPRALATAAAFKCWCESLSLRPALSQLIHIHSPWSEWNIVVKYPGGRICLLTCSILFHNVHNFSQVIS